MEQTKQKAGEEKSLPPIINLASVSRNPPPLPEELIGGVLRRGHKMLVAGASKAGKSFLMMELCIAVAEGDDWLGFPCLQGRVLYVNLEIDPASCVHRFLDIYARLNIEPVHFDRIDIWNLRGYSEPLAQLTPKLLERITVLKYDLIVLDPIYKLNTADENSAGDMSALCNEFDRICTKTGSALVYCHHHSKGAQGSKRSIDRASGSGVFARDPDALLDLIRLQLPPDVEYKYRDYDLSAWRLEGTLREFPSFPPRDIWFSWPIHWVDMEGELADAMPEGSPGANLLKSPKRVSLREQYEKLERVFDFLDGGRGRGVPVKALAKEMRVDEKTIRRYIHDMNNVFENCNGVVYRLKQPS